MNQITSISDLTIDTLWERLEAYQERPYYTSRGLSFTYILRGGELFIDRKKKSLTKATVGVALQNAKELDGIVAGPKKLGCFGSSYLYPVFLEMGIIQKK